MAEGTGDKDAATPAIRTPLSFAAAIIGDVAKVGVGVAAVLLLVGATIFVGQQTFANVLIVDPIDVPDSLQKAGLTGDAITRRLTHDIAYVQSIAQSARVRPDTGHPVALPAKELPDVQLPEAKISLQAVAHAFRDFLGLPTRHVVVTIQPNAGHARTRADSAYRLTVAVSGEPLTELQFGFATLDSTVRLAAKSVVGSVDPTVLAFYELQAADTVQAVSLAYSALSGPRRDGDAAAYWLIGAVESVHHQDLNAIEHLRLALTRDPNLAQAYVWWGITLEHQGRRAEALQMYEFAGHIDPTLGWAFSDAGDVLFLTGHYDDARSMYLQAIRVDPTGDAAYRGLGDYANYEKSDVAAAGRWYTEALARNGNNYATMEVFGDLQAAQGNWDWADTSYSRAITINPRHAYAHLGMAYADLARGRYAEAACELRTARINTDSALARDSADESAFVDLASIYELAQEPGDADYFFQRAQFIDSGDVFLYNRRGNLWSDYADTLRLHGGPKISEPFYIGADSLYLAARAHGTAAVDIAVNRGYVREKLNDTAGAVRLYTEALQLDDRSGLALVGLAAMGQRTLMAHWRDHMDSTTICRPGRPSDIIGAHQDIASDDCRQPNREIALFLGRTADTVGAWTEATARFDNLTRFGPPNGLYEALMARDLNRIGYPDDAAWHFHRADSLGFREQWIYPIWAAAAAVSLRPQAARPIPILAASRLKMETDRRRSFLLAAEGRAPGPTRRAQLTPCRPGRPSR